MIILRDLCASAVGYLNHSTQRHGGPDIYQKLRGCHHLGIDQILNFVSGID